MDYDSTGMYPSIAIDSNDGVHIVFQADGPIYGLKFKYGYMPKDSTFFRKTIVPGYDNDRYAGYFNAITVDSNNSAHMVQFYSPRYVIYSIGYNMFPCTP